MQRERRTRRAERYTYAWGSADERLGPKGTQVGPIRRRTMTNHTHRFRAALLIGMASISLLLTLYGCGGSDEPTPSTQLDLSGQVNRSSTFTSANLQTFPPTTQNQGPVPGSFTGVLLWT